MKASTAMDELLRDFLTETHESIDVVDVELVRFEQDPNNAKILNNIFRLVHTIKGTCGFLNLPRLEALTHAAEALMGKFRDGAPRHRRGRDADPCDHRPHQSRCSISSSRTRPSRRATTAT